MRPEQEDLQAILTIINPTISEGVENYLNYMKEAGSKDNQISKTARYIDTLFHPMTVSILMLTNFEKKPVSSNYGFDHTKEDVFEALGLEKTPELMDYAKELENDFHTAITTVAKQSPQIQLTDLTVGLLPTVQKIFDNTNYTMIHKSLFMLKLFHIILYITFGVMESMTQKEAMASSESPSQFNN